VDTATVIRHGYSGGCGFHAYDIIVIFMDMVSAVEAASSEGEGRDEEGGGQKDKE
jgi:hypothetical protein